MAEKFAPDQKNTALIMIDIQERLFAVMKDKIKNSLINNCLHLMELSKMLSIPVVVTEQYPKGLGLTVDDLRESLLEYKPIEKIAFNCCDEPYFMNEISRLDKSNFLLVGMETHICVLQTCIGLIKRGYNVHLVKDAVCSRTKENWITGVEYMRDAGAVITSTETFLFQMLNVAGTEQFKAISRRIK